MTNGGVSTPVIFCALCCLLHQVHINEECVEPKLEQLFLKKTGRKEEGREGGERRRRKKGRREKGKRRWESGGGGSGGREGRGGAITALIFNCPLLEINLEICTPVCRNIISEKTCYMFR